ncbi:MAG: serine/threonine protein kinase, partial [Myxococcota bacterium]
MSDAQVFGKYRLVRRLAFGGMAEIFLARLVGDQGFEKTLVLKRILPQFSSDPDFTRMFVDEAVLAARLTHPNVAQIYDFGEVDGIYFITMELVDGADLRRVIKGAFERGRGLLAVEVAAIGEGMARGLAYVHALETDDGKSLGIVHRDISPHNVMLTRGGDVKIMDFGIAKAAARATHTATGTIKGKLAYMAPEQALAEELDKRADQYAVGLTLWECLVGRRVFDGDSEPELLSKVAAGRVRDVRAEKADVPEPLARIIMRMLALKREDRYPDMRDVEQDLVAFRYGLGAAGAVRLSGIVDEVAPRETPKPTASPARMTAVLPSSEPSQPGTQELSMESGWSAAGETEATRAATPEMVAPAAPTVLLPKRARVGAWTVAVLVTLLVAAGGATIAARMVAARRAQVTIASEPAGASLSLVVDGETLATGLVTPATLNDRRIGEELAYRLELAGYVPLAGTVDIERAEETIKQTLKPVAEQPST